MFKPGIYVASVTPFDAENEVNGDALQRLMERNLREGAAGFFLGGSSAECWLISHEERVRVFEAAAAFKDETRLIAHCGAMSTAEAIEYAVAAKALGYEEIAATAPFYYAFTPAQICDYYYDIYEATGIPVIVYNFPGNTHVDFDLNNEHYRKLFTSGAIRGVKHTNQVVFQMERFLELNPALEIYNGFDETMVAGLALGSRASIGSTFNCMLPHYLRIYNTFLAGDLEGARDLQHKANNTMAAMCKVGLIPAVKYLLQEQGNDCGLPRAPFHPLTDEQKAYLDAEMAANLVTA